MTLPRRCTSIVILSACFALGCAIGVQARSARARAGARSDKAAAEAGPALIDLAGYQQMVASYHGKALMVTFWATWCEPCRDEYPMIVDLAKKYAPQGLAVVGVSLDENSDVNLVHQFLAQARPDFPNYRQKSGIDVNAFYHGVNPAWHGTMPQTIFYGRDGHIARYLIGASPQMAFENAIRLILIKSAAENGKTISTAVGE
ncbi:MAG: TlpA family protein disulfide reductase [Candidatus Acidiferrales bacterium]